MAVGPDEFFKRLEESGLLNHSILEQKDQVLKTDSAEGVAAGLVEQKLLTPYQSEVLVSGDQIPLVVGDYVATDSIGRGGMMGCAHENHCGCRGWVRTAVQSSRICAFVSALPNR